MPNRPASLPTLALCVAAACLAGPLQAQNVKPPKAQLWMDVSTGTMAGMPEMDLPAGMGGGLGAMMGGRGGAGASAATTYGMARGMNVMPPRVLDIAFYNSLKPGVEAAQSIPPGMRMGASLPLLPHRAEPAAAPGDHEPTLPRDVQRPTGRVLIYWGCSESVRAGQPRVIDLARGSPADFANAFAGRHAPDRTARVGATHVLYPNERNTVMLARDSSLVGEHQVHGEGVPASMKFTLGEAQDVMPAIQLQMRGTLQDSIAVGWAPVAHARAYYLHAMSSNGNDMILWSSAETPDTGMGLFDYLPNATIDQWVREHVLLRADATRCAVPKGIFAPGTGAREQATPMLRVMAYGGESNIVYPPRPADLKAAWEPEWAVRLRMKSHTMAMLGQEVAQGSGAREPTAINREEAPPPATTGQPPELRLPNPAAILRDLLKR